MEALYPAAPAAVPESLTQATKAYRRQAWVAMLALLAFAVFYVALTGWFSWKAFYLLRAAVQGSREGIVLFGGGVAAAFIAVFMLKALFFVKRGELSGLTEITAREQPELFAFLHRLADEARAPRPKRVFLSARVNAAVFYDLSPLNLLFPSRKNLEIGLALVNVLTLSELKAVLAHEFGHFAQRSMAVGRWVYVAQQIAGHIVAHRDALDRFLRGLSSIDVRIAWIGWLLSLVIWAIRSVVDTFFRVVLAAERALSREMEFQADRIAVSLSGSDALIEALYRLQAADMAWDRALAFANSEADKGHMTADLFEVQSAVIERLRAILDDPSFGRPPRAIGEPAVHRIFKKELVHASRMWATHPFNHEREENAKRHYLPVPQERASAWTVFRDAPALRLKVSAALFRQADTPLPLATREESLAALEAEYGRESYKRIYRGCYLTRPVTRTEERAEELYGRGPVDRGTLYPVSLSADLKRLEDLQKEKAQLEAMLAGEAKAADGQLRFRGKPIRPKQLPLAIGKVDGELKAAETRLADHDRLCRTAGREIAREQGQGWEAYVLGLLRLVHYAEHLQANVADAQGALANVVSMVTAKRKTLNKKELERVLTHSGELYALLDEVHGARDAVQPDAATLQQMGVASWPAALGEWKFAAPSSENIGQWIDSVDSWIQPVLTALGKLRRAALDQLLVTEGRLSRAAYERQTLEAAPAAPQVPAQYSIFTLGSERPRQEKLDWWSRFHVADGWVPGTVRLLVAAGIIGTLMGMSTGLGNAHLAIHNGLDRVVVVQVGSQTLHINPAGTQTMDLEVDAPIQVTARTTQGKVIETFSETPDLLGGQYIYNIASASPMVEWTAVYGNASPVPRRPLGAPRWFLSSVDFLLRQPPEQIQTKGGGGRRSVLSAADRASPSEVFGMSEDDASRAKLIAVHARWDQENSAYLNEWLALLRSQPAAAEILRARLADQPLDIAALRAEQDLLDSQASAAACERQRALAARQPQQGDLQYLAVRCMDRSDPQREAAFRDGHVRFPTSSWFAYAAGSGYAADGNWAAAASAYQTAIKLPLLANEAAIELARIRRVEQGPQAKLQDLAAKSESLREQLALESGAGVAEDSGDRVYVELGRGRLNEVSKLLASAKRPRILRLAAASDGAPAELVQRSLALPAQQGLDPDAIWSAIGLALRHGRPIDELMVPLNEHDPQGSQPIRKFIAVMQGSRDVQQAEAALAGAALQQRAQAYVMGVIILGAQAPAHWRDFAKRVLFVSERPYLS